ncbi:MAG TPA: hypothetical protein PKA88_00640 [Polyangiaceae bacterium]|nr:hypothetical protein [Polyangiaceae bacterium]HMR79096.1 hypothetical protein [Polyangiaceae bacterium]
MGGTLPKQIAVAKSAIAEAEGELNKLVKGSLLAPRAEKVEIGDGIRVAFSKLAEAKATLAELDRTATHSKVAAAQVAIAEAEQNLDRVVRELSVDQTPDNTLVSEVVSDAFNKLRQAKATLVDLEKTLPAEEN